MDDRGKQLFVFRGLIMRGFVVVLLGVVLGLAGCGGVRQEQPVDSSVVPVTQSQVEEAPAAFHFHSGDLVLGEYDPTTIWDDIFNPCTEISKEEFASLGLVVGEPVVLPKSQSVGCDIVPQDYLVDTGFLTSAVKTKSAEERTPRPLVDESAIIPNSYEIPFVEGDFICFFGVETTRGTLMAFAEAWDTQLSYQELCKVAQHNLELLYSLGR